MGVKPRTDDRGGGGGFDDSSPLTRPGLTPRRSDTSRLGLLPGVVQQRREQHLGVGVFLTPVEGERSSGGEACATLLIGLFPCCLRPEAR